MARLASVVKQGYFPAPPEAVAGILRHLRIPDLPPDSLSRAGDINILDPCAGEGKALVQLAEGLGVSKGRAFAVELNARRAAIIAESHPEVRLLGPCSSESPMPIVRAVWSDGTIRTFSDQVASDEAPFDDQQTDVEDE